MGNQLRGEFPVEFKNGDEKLLRFDLNAVCELEQRLKMPMSKIFSDDNAGLLVIREALCVGLKSKGNRNITPKMVGDMMDPKRLAYYGKLVGEAINFAMGGEEDENEDEDEDESKDPLENAPAAVAPIAV